MENQDKYPDMETWLAHHGFKAHPFENILAEKDPYLDNYFEYFPFLREIEKPRSSFLFLERGKGKSANRIILTQQCDKSLKTSEKKLAVPYTDFSRLIKKDKVTLADHVEEILKEAVPRLYDLCIQRGIEKLPGEFIKEFVWFISKYSDKLNPLSITMQIDRIEGLSDEEKKNILSKLVDILKGRVQKPLENIVPGASVLFDLLSVFLNIKTDQEKLSQIEHSPLDFMSRFAEIAKYFNINYIYILIDQIDEFSQQNDFLWTTNMLKPLIETIPLLEMRPYVFKFFLPAEMKDNIFQSLRQDRFDVHNREDFFDVYEYTWQPNELKKMFEHRLDAYVDKTQIIEKVERHDFSRLFSERKDIVSEMVQFADHSPRNLLALAKIIFEEHTKSNQIDELISKEAYERAIIRFNKSYKKSEKKVLAEVKVLLVGNGGSGKTSLVRCLRGESFDKYQAKTDGIEILPWNIEVETQKIKARLWDFGGQEIMHTTHLFFLSKRSLYILLLDGRKEEDPEYWLKHIESFGGDSPILIVMNKADDNPGFDVNRKFLQDKYKGIIGFYRISCKTGIGIDEFSTILKNALMSVEITKTIWEDNWFKVKSHLEKKAKHYISYQEFREICENVNITEGAAQDRLLSFLNDLGIVVHFKKYNLLDTQVLDPKWITEAVYRIINSEELAKNKGILNICSLDEILKKSSEINYSYPPEKYKYIVNLMEEFELCYTFDKDKILIPDLLEIQEPNFDFDYSNALKFRFEYDFLPKSIMPRFIVKRHQDINNRLRWRTGVVLEDKAFRAVAVIKADVRDRKIEIWVMGEQKRDYFSVIRKTLTDINKSFEKLDVKELIPLDDHPEIAIEYEELLGVRI